jgi:hypothetical protein
LLSERGVASWDYDDKEVIVVYLKDLKIKIKHSFLLIQLKQLTIALVKPWLL